MAYNAINKLPQNVFTGLFRLRNLDLSNNQIEELNNSVFSACQELQYLDLSHNKLTELSPEVFSGIPALQVHKYILKVGLITEKCSFWIKSPNKGAKSLS